MKPERDKFLTKAIGECWHDYSDFARRCKQCGTSEDIFPQGYKEKRSRNNFSTWAGFGKLWKWAQGQEWWPSFVEDSTGISDPSLVDVDYINPDRFADAVYEFLNGGQQ